MKIKALLIIASLAIPGLSYAQQSCLKPAPPIPTGTSLDAHLIEIYRIQMQAHSDCLRNTKPVPSNNEFLNPFRTGALGPTAPAHKPDETEWQSARNIGSNETGDYSIKNCLYRTIGGFLFSINRTDFRICPYSVQVNPTTGQVRFDDY